MMEARSILGECELFKGLSDAALDTLATCAEPLTVRGGDELFAAGDVSDAIYIVATGRLRAVLPSGQIAGNIGRLEPIGEIGVLSGEPRGASVHALRDSVLLRFSREAFYAFILDNPAALMAMARVIMARLRQNSREARLAAVRRTHAFTVVGAEAEIPTSAVAASLARALQPHGTVKLINAQVLDAELGPGSAAAASASRPGDTRILEWLNKIEAGHDYLIYDGGFAGEAWSLRALRQADRVLVVAAAHRTPQPSRAIEALVRASVRTPVDAVLLRPDGADGSATLAWKKALRAGAHFYLRPDSEPDVASLARQLTGRGIGLVLGGGGARGFAHIGLLRALKEVQIPIDLVGGTSMGAFISALHAVGHDIDAIIRYARDTFVERNLLNDYAWPRVAIIKGRKFRRQLQVIFGDDRIEHLRKPYFCVSTNLTRGAPRVHDEGRLADWVATSMCIPGVAPPVAFEGELYADGAVVNSLPTDVMQALGRGPIIASDVSTEGSVAAPGVNGPDPDFEAVHQPGPDGKRVTLIDLLFRTSTLTSESGTRARADRADLYLRMPVGGIGTFDWKQIDSLEEKGYRHAMTQLEAARGRLLV